MRAGLPRGHTVLLMIGTNDAESGLSATDSEQNLAAIVAALRGRTVIVQSVLPTDRSVRNERARVLNAFARRLCARTVACTFLDLAPDFAKGDGIDPALTVDGVHLTWPGYQRWRRRIAPVVAAAE